MPGKVFRRAGCGCAAFLTVELALMQWHVLTMLAGCLLVPQALYLMSPGANVVTCTCDACICMEVVSAALIPV